jgi:hypothetical protein
MRYFLDNDSFSANSSDLGIFSNNDTGTSNRNVKLCFNVLKGRYLLPLSLLLIVVVVVVVVVLILNGKHLSALLSCRSAYIFLRSLNTKENM